MRKILLISLVAAQTMGLFAQLQNPPKLNWKQIETRHFRVVCPESILSEGKRTATILENNWVPVNKSLQQNTRPISVFLFNQSVISNGYTRLAPREMVFYTTPPQDANMLGATDWLQLLSIHEYRHAVQFSKLNQGLTYYMGKIFGDYGKLVFMNISTPAWVFEGDAVCTETALTESGRGRLPSFNRDIRALELENKRYSYNQSYLGSYKVFFPNHYYLGYLMVSHIRNNYSDRIWNKVLNKSTNTSFWPYAISTNLKGYTGNNLNHTYKNTLNEYDSIWTANSATIIVDSFETIATKESKVYTNYTYPFAIGADSILALKTGFDNIPTLVLVHNNMETNLLEINPADRIHSNGKLVVWSTPVPDIRWGERSYSNIMAYRIKTGETFRITSYGKYFAPALSPSGEFVAAVEYGTDMQCNIAIIKTSDGQLVKKISLPSQHVANMPSWSDNEKQLVFIQNFNSQKTISIVDVEKGTITNLIPYSNEVISTCIFWKNYILYGTPIMGIDGILALDLSSGITKRVISGKYGVYNPSMLGDDDSICFQAYSTDGFKPGKMGLDPSAWKDPSIGHDAGDNYFNYLVEIEKANGFVPNHDTSLAQSPEITNYSPLKNSIVVHSWAPYPVTQSGIGFSITSNDKLNTLAAKAGVEYYPNIVASREYLNLSYAALFPVFDVEYSNGRKYISFASSDTSDDYYGHDENFYRFGITLPFDFSRNVYSTSLKLNGGYSYSLVDFAESTPQFYRDKFSAWGPDFLLEFSNTKYRSHRQYYPQWGQQVAAYYNRLHFKEGEGSLRSFTLNSNLFFPGLFHNHSLRMNIGYEYNSTAQYYGFYWLSRKLQFTRGYEANYYTEFYKLTTAYSLPLFYPDLSITRAIYCNRIRGEVFYDIGQSNIYKRDFTTYQSVGMDLIAEMYFFSLPIPIQMGLRISHTLTDNSNTAEFLILGVAF